MEKYICKECEKEVTVQNGLVTRSCEHKGTIILQMDVVCTGEGGTDA